MRGDRARKLLPPALLVLLVLVVAGAVHTEYAAAQTVPTRTPTPSANPTATPGAGGGGPTATPESGDGSPTATRGGPTLTPTATSEGGGTVATPEGGYVPTADACSANPTLIADLSKVNVRSGPGLDYDPVGEILYLEVRPIIGRAADAAWWLVTMADGDEGWIADAVVSVQGYAAAVPIVETPLLPDGTTATPGAPWSPTPPPNCTPPPTATPTATPSATPTSSATPSPTATQTATAVPSETPTALPSATATQTATAEVAVSGGDVPTSVAPETEASTDGDGSVLLPLAIAAAVLLGAGAIVILRRRA